MKKINFLPSLTTLNMNGEASDWRRQVEEIKNMKLEEIALFPTFLKENERYELYDALKKTSLKRIPFVHLRTDMKLSELDFLVENFGTKVFNLHTTSNWPLIHDYSKYAKRIFIENGKTVPTEEELSKFGGICIDFSHWENMVKCGNIEYDREMRERLKKFPIGVSHISAIGEKSIPSPFATEIMQFDTHRLENLAMLDYMKKYAEFIPNIAAIELENSIDKQLEAKEYLQGILA